MKAARLFAAAILAAGIVFLVCRYALLPMDTDFGWVQKLGIALAMVGGLGVKSLEGDVKTSILAASGLVGAALAVAAVFLFIRPVLSADVELVRVEIQGIGFDAPVGQPKTGGTSAIGSWQQNKIGGRKGMVQLNWESGRTELSPEAYGKILAAGGTPLGTPLSEPTTVNSHSGKLLTLRVKSTALYSSAWHCDEHDRDYTLGTLVNESLQDGLSFHRKIAESVTCHVGDKAELVFNLPLIELPAGFGRVEDSDPPTFGSLNGSEIAIQASQTAMTEAIVKRPVFITTMFETSGEFESVNLDGPSIKRKARDGRERVLTRVSFTESGTPNHATVTAFECDGDDHMLIAVYPSTEFRDPIEESLLSATCANGAPPQQHPSAEKVLTDACDGGDFRGCYQLGSLAESSVPPEMGLAKAWYERGCGLDGAAACNDLGVMLANDGQNDEALKLYEKACSLGEQLGCNNAKSE